MGATISILQKTPGHRFTKTVISTSSSTSHWNTCFNGLSLNLYYKWWPREMLPYIMKSRYNKGAIYYYI